MAMVGITPYEQSRLQWRTMDAYWPDKATEGPCVLFAWQGVAKWQFGFGHGTWPMRGLSKEAYDGPTYWVGEWDVKPECFAYVTPPKRRK